MKLTTYLKEKIPPEIKHILLLFFITRIVLTIIGVLSHIVFESSLIQAVYDPFHGKNYIWDFSKHLWLNIWGRWDTGWYLDIAKNWYSTVPNAAGQTNYAFFPFYPLLIKLLGIFIGNYYIAGLIISNISLIIACIFLYKLVRIDYEHKIAIRTITFLFLFPSAFILSGVFTEALFLALIIMCFYYARKENWRLAGILGFLLSLTRNIGVVIILPLLYEYLKERNFRIKKIKPDIVFLLLIPLGLFVFAVYNYFSTGDFLFFLHTQQIGWGTTFRNPLGVLFGSIFWYILGRYGVGIEVFFNGIFSLLIITILLLFYRKLRFSYWLLGMLLIFIPLCGNYAGMCSILRFSLVIFPLYILFAKLTQNFYAEQLLTILLALLQGFLMVLWVNGFRFVV